MEDWEVVSVILDNMAPIFCLYLPNNFENKGFVAKVPFQFSFCAFSVLYPYIHLNFYFYDP